MYIWLRFSRRIPRASCFASSWYGKDRNQLLRELVDVQYGRNDIDFKRGTFRVRGDVVEIFPHHLMSIVFESNFSVMKSIVFVK